jgi:hypothetical protein
MIEDGRAGPTMSLPSVTHVSLASGIVFNLAPQRNGNTATGMAMMTWMAGTPGFISSCPRPHEPMGGLDGT